MSFVCALHLVYYNVCMMCNSLLLVFKSISFWNVSYLIIIQVSKLSTELETVTEELDTLQQDQEQLMSELKERLSEDYNDKLATLSSDYSERIEAERSEMTVNMEQSLEDLENQLEYK